jgi:branched-chain amino acid transport system ATP-binding protein
LLKVEGLNVSYGYLQVLWDISLEISRGEVVTLVGSNGAGKTTLVSAILGLLRAQSGTISFNGREISGLPPYEVVRHHLSLVPEKRELFSKMTVYENLTMGGYIRGDISALGEIYDLFPILEEKQHQAAGTLSGGQQQMLAIARSLMARPEMIILDEPSLGLSPKFVHIVLEAVQYLSSQGLTILLVEQNIRQALEISNRAYIIENGRITREGAAPELLHDPSIKESYLGM